MSLTLRPYCICAMLLICPSARAQRTATLRFLPTASSETSDARSGSGQTQFLIETDSESVPNAFPITVPGYGDTFP
jgi:hypothetical protein